MTVKFQANLYLFLCLNCRANFFQTLKLFCIFSRCYEVKVKDIF